MKIKTLDQLGISKAPWRKCIHYIEADDGSFIADVGTFMDATVKADINLIAAAPKLYEACRKLVNWDGGANGALLDIVAEAKAALAEAGGVTESEVAK